MYATTRAVRGAPRSRDQCELNAPGRREHALAAAATVVRRVTDAAPASDAPTAL
jgi:hypothetical protein